MDFLVTNDFAGAEVGKAVYSPLCRDNGTVIDDLIAYKLSEEEVLICVNAANIQKDWDWVSSHSSKFDCTLTNESDDHPAFLALQGPDGEKILRELEIFPSDDFVYYSAKRK